MADGESTSVSATAVEALTVKEGSTPRAAESLALESILAAGNVSIRAFFESIWQKQCGLFGKAHEHPSGTSSAATTADLPRAQPRLGDDPYRALVRNGWSVLVRLLESASGGGAVDGEAGDGDSDTGEEAFRPLLFHRQVQVPPDLAMTKYGANLFSAYLDGCSVVLNHSEAHVAEIFDLCADLQRSFPHAYANAYLTPPGLQAVPPHADDRDVLVVQVVGEKNWRVYRAIPVPHPYPHEQVGKDGLPVPAPVLDQVLVERTLRPGDVLYMPRGYVHEACASSDSLSFHVTVALATHDWSLAGCLSEMASKIWTNELELRPAMHRDIGTIPLDAIDDAVARQLQRDLDRAIQMLKEFATVEAVHHRMKVKYDHHIQNALYARQERIKREENRTATQGALDNDTAPASGPHAALHVTLDTPLRCSTPEEKAHVVATRSDRSPPRGLHVRDEIFEPITTILQSFKEQNTKSFTMRHFASIHGSVCDLTLLAFARLCVEQGALVIVPGGLEST